MLAEARGPDLQGPGAPCYPPTAGEDTEDPVNQHRPQGGERQRRISSRKTGFLGLETRPELLWEDWDQGKDSTKTLVLKNTHDKIQRLHLRPPETKFFTILCPNIIFLSPGLSFSILITFRPLQRYEYEDSIGFQGKEGSVVVRLRATVPCLALEVPDSVLLPVCAVQHSSHITFPLKNASKLQTSFKWDCGAPFQFSPDQGLLKPGQECHITVVFQPQEALVHRQRAYCRFGEEEDKAESCCTVLLQGLGKYPYLQLRNPAAKEEKEQEASVLHFGSVAVGQSLQKHFDIFNPSAVTSSFSLSRLSGGVPLLGSEFLCDVTGGEVAPGGSLRATVTFSPAVVDTVSVEYLSLKCSGALNEDQLKLAGSCIGPKLSLSASVLDFGCVDDGEACTQTLELVNSSPVEGVYQWDLDCSGHSVFSIQPASGAVQPHSQTTLTAVYRPTQPIAHHRRVACVILHRDHLFLDLIGTCHSELQKPAILKPEHLVLYKLHWYRSQIPQNTPGAMEQEPSADLAQQDQRCTLEEPNQRPDSSTVVQKTPMEEFYQFILGGIDPISSSSTSSPHVSVSPRELLFNHKMSSSSFLSTSSASSQSVSITNYTRGKLSLVWTEAQDSQFTVSPSSCDLAPLKSTSFRVTYDPKPLNAFHGAQLECFAFYKMEDHHIGVRVLCPPWCVTVRVIGHSFSPGKEHFIPCCSLKPPQVVFPGVNAVSYQTALLQNCGELPLTFCLDVSSNPAMAKSVSVIPNCGLIQPGLHQIFTLRSTPTVESPEQGFCLKLQLNAAKHRPAKELTVVSVVEKLCVSLEGEGTLYFQPTAVGSRTRRSHHIRNLSPLPLRFQWSIQQHDQELISVEPDAGEIHPNEILIQTWSFSPLAKKTYTLKPTLSFWPSRTDGANKSLLTLTVEGMGSNGFIEAKKAVLDVKETLVGNYRSFEIPLVNNSLCSVSFQLSVQQTILDEELVSDPETEPCALQLDCERGTIASRCTLLLQSRFRPHRRGQYSWKISDQTTKDSGLESSSSKAVCEVRAKGVFPTLQVTGVCGGGSLGTLSRMHLWQLFSLDSLNRHLLSNTSSAELIHRTPTKHSRRSGPSHFTKVMLDFNFSAAPIRSEPSTFRLMFHNPGSVPVDWAFLFPEDQQIELDYWEETGVFSSTELSQMKVQGNRLFSISPRSATLQPGQQRAVLFRYRHDSVGTNRFAVVLKLCNGREILLNLQGATVERNRPYLHFPFKRHVLTSMTIGDFSPPRQGYVIYNAGTVPVHYEVDTAALSQLQMDNFNHPVLCCLSPEGEVPAGETALLEWIFSPLEAKTYHMDVPIHIQDGDSTLVRFEGCGSVTPTLGSSNTLNCSDTKESAPCVQRRPFPGQLVFLSADLLSLGNIPVCSETSRILFLTNVSCTDTVHYTWDLPKQGAQQVVQIRPDRGVLSPEEVHLCVVSFTSTRHPTVYKLDLICQVFQEVALTRYQKALQHLEEERRKERDEFTITDQKLSEPVAASLRKDSPFRKYKTLPPICASRGCVSAGATCSRVERRAQREMAKIPRQPEPPQPALLHLEVTAHSHGLLEYNTHFPDQLNKFHRCLPSVEPQKPESAAGTMPGPSHIPEWDTSVHVLTTLLWNIVEDSAFVQSLFTLACKPVDYQPTGVTPSPCPPSSPCPRPQAVSSGTEVTVDSAGTAPLGTRDKQHTDCAPVDVIKDVLPNTFQNLMMEAVRGELCLWEQPGAILSPVSTR
ncbi:cilia- and flagella-associated protein 65 [Pleuronectes platessa]|uniref:cilia- and flagella-associated protein 65 n=1 Tax=Pleuronectes platessa TaxID=8262 RepID=UPI00232A5D3F|nr:cilia- and flagella-associated protein 65 [Pleuronectes platessa]